MPAAQAAGASPPSTAARPDARPVIRFELQVKTETGKVLKLQGQEVSRAGCFLCTEVTPPTLLSRVTVTFPDVGLLQAQVVRHVTREQAEAWRLPQGFGLQFLELRADQREVLDHLGEGRSLAQLGRRSAADDPVAAKTLADFRRRMEGDHYIMLGVALDADVTVVRYAARELLGQLSELGKRSLSPAQLRQVDEATARVREALDVLGVPSRRAEFDGLRYNWKGVVQCLAAGLRVTEMDSSRTLFLRMNPGADARSRIYLVTAHSLEKESDLPEALKTIELALAVDPLFLEAHQRRTALLKRLERKP